MVSDTLLIDGGIELDSSRLDVISDNFDKGSYFEVRSLQPDWSHVFQLPHPVPTFAADDGVAAKPISLLKYIPCNRSSIFVITIE